MKTRVLPPRMYEKDGGFYYVRKNKWTHLGASKAEALARYARMEHGLSISDSAAPSWESMKRYLFATYQRSLKGARLRDITHDLTRSEYDEIVARANGNCEVTGIRFEISIWKGCGKRPFAPSLDRIDSSIGYTKSNCRLVCGIVNAAMGAWGDDVFWSMINRAKRLKHRDCFPNIETSGVKKSIESLSCDTM